MRKTMITGMALSLLSLCSGARATPNVTAIAAGGSHGLALLSDGTVWAWGNNYFGQLGDGTTSDRPAPIQVAGLTGVAAVAAGYGHSLALKDDGSVWAWGTNGDGTPAVALTPVKVNGLDGVMAISALGWSSLALESDGTVWAWDSDPWGSRTLVQVSGLTGVAAISGGGFGWSGLYRGLALKSDGTVWAWGASVGDGTTAYRATPVQVSGLTGVRTIAAGNFCSLAIQADGTVWGWGYRVTSPVQVTGLEGVVAVAAGAPNLAVKSDGTVWAWAWDWYGSFPPAQVDGLTGATVVAASNSGMRLALKNDGSIWAWGGNENGQLGDGTPVWRSSPVQVIGLGGAAAVTTPPRARQPLRSNRVNGLAGAAPIAAGVSYSLAVNGDGTAWAWGWLLPDLPTAKPVQVSGLTGVVALAAGLGPYLALEGDGTVWESRAYRRTPAQVSGLSEVQGIASACHDLAVKADGSVWAWGDNADGQLGDGTTKSRATPVQLIGLSGVTAVAAACVQDFWDWAGYSLALKSDGTVWAWGGTWGADGKWTRQLTPVQVSGLSGITAIAADGRGGAFGNVALKNDGTVWTWGAYTIPPIGSLPAQVSGLAGVVKIAAGGSHNLASKGDRTVWAWGKNGFGQLGDGTTTDRSTPVQVGGLSDVTAIAAGDSHSLALKKDGTVWAWGSDLSGQLGDGRTLYRSTPAPVIQPGSADLAER